MPLSISIRFLTGRAHLHHWQAHHSDGKVDWPPSPWRLLRALVAAAGSGLTSLPGPLDAKVEPKEGDDLPVTRLANLLATIAFPPNILLPRTSGGHTRQFLQRHVSGTVKSTGSAVFDTFATVSKETPVVFEWPDVALSPGDQKFIDLQALLRRMNYFGRAESWCDATASLELPVAVIPEKTHWRCVCLAENSKPAGREHADYTLERKLTGLLPLDGGLRAQAAELLPQCGFKVFEEKGQKWRPAKPAECDFFKAMLPKEDPGISLLRCLLRASGEDIENGLERPIGTRWVHYAVSRAIYQVPPPRASPRPKPKEPIVTLVRFALNTATVNRAVLPPLTDTLLVADKFRAAALAWHSHLLRRSGQHVAGMAPRNLCGRENDGSLVVGHDHAFFWPTDEDGDGFLDHVDIFCPRGLEADEVEALRRLLRLKQRGGRPDLLVTPVFLGRHEQFWLRDPVRTFISATPYFCPLHLTHGNGRSGRRRPVTRYVLDSLRETLHLPHDAADPDIQEIRYLPGESAPKLQRPDEPPVLGSVSGFWADEKTRFICALAFCRRRRNHEIKGPGLCFKITFPEPMTGIPFAIGDQAHFGLGRFIPLE
jgi:CRISPR-associated protein Csb2